MLYGGRGDVSSAEVNGRNKKGIIDDNIGPLGKEFDNIKKDFSFSFRPSSGW